MAGEHPRETSGFPSELEEREIQAWRQEFPILEKSVYLINNSLGAMPRRVSESLQEYAQRWAERGIRAWEETWWEMPRQVGDLLASLLGAGADEVSMHPNVTIAEWIVLSCLLVTPKRNQIVYTDQNFPSIRYFYQTQPELQVHVVPCPDGVNVPLGPLLEAIDERTLLVPISHVTFKSSFVQEVEAVIRRAHSVGARVVLDTYQSCGAMPLRVQELGADFVVGGSVKWLCGGPGAAYLYVRSDLKTSLKPRLTGWMAHRAPFDFSPEMEYADSSYRFLHGTPNIPALYAARCGYEIIRQVGVERIRQRSLRLTERLMNWADELGWTVMTPRQPERRGGHVTIQVPGGEGISRELVRRGYLVDFRPGAGIRIAPHFYNTEEEVDAVMEAIRRLLGKG